MGSRWLWGRSWNWCAEQSACRSSAELQRPIGLASAGGSRVWVGSGWLFPCRLRPTSGLKLKPGIQQQSSPSVCDCLWPAFPRDSGCRQSDASSATMHFPFQAAVPPHLLSASRLFFFSLSVCPITSRLTASHAGTHVPANQLPHHPHPASWSWFRMQPLPGVCTATLAKDARVGIGGTMAATGRGEATIRSLLIILRSSLHRTVL